MYVFLYLAANLVAFLAGRATAKARSNKNVLQDLMEDSTDEAAIRLVASILECHLQAGKGNPFRGAPNQAIARAIGLEATEILMDLQDSPEEAVQALRELAEENLLRLHWGGYTPDELEAQARALMGEVEVGVEVPTKSFKELYEETERLAPILFADGETHHGELINRVNSIRRLIGRGPEAALIATIQTGYWPDWLEGLPAELEERLAIHCSEVEKLPCYGTSSFGGWFYVGEEG